MRMNAQVDLKQLKDIELIKMLKQHQEQIMILQQNMKLINDEIDERLKELDGSKENNSENDKE